MAPGAVPASQPEPPAIAVTTQISNPPLPSPNHGAAFQPQIAPQPHISAASIPLRPRNQRIMSVAQRPMPMPPPIQSQGYSHYGIISGSAPPNLVNLPFSASNPSVSAATGASVVHQPMPDGCFAAGPVGTSLPVSNQQMQQTNNVPSSHMTPQPRYQMGYGSYHVLPQHQNMAMPGQPTASAQQMSYFMTGQMSSSQVSQYQDASYFSSSDTMHPGVSGYRGVNDSSSGAASNFYPDSSSPLVVSRGPPRKPRQSGHAIWVGNLPPGASVVDLKDHFSKDLTNDIESVKLISKSNCAFVNYKTKSACTAAMSRFHDSKFHGTRLVCRLRKSAVPNPSAVLASIHQVASSKARASEDATSPTFASPLELIETVVDKTHRNETEVTTAEPVDGDPTIEARFFILKSLTLQDLETSTRNGFWATQAHNEDALNGAYKSAKNVYLVFSANKSGEYFGYARMASPIPAPNVDLSQILLPATRAPESVTFAGFADYGPRSIPTPATEWAPKGRVIDDSARGTIFWEADLDDEYHDDLLSLTASTMTIPAPKADHRKPSQPPVVDTTVSSHAGSKDPTDYPVIARSPTESRKPSADDAAPVASTPAQPQPDSSATSSTAPPSIDTTTDDKGPLHAGDHGNPFRIEWLSTRKVPFYRTRGLRNPWNNSREIKIARDGTEIEPQVGQRLLMLFGPGVP